nr:hypothetical protein [Tanacetum cinerariifolium]
MLDRIDFTSCQQCIRLYCQGKENGVNILKSIDGGPFQMGPVRETLAEGTEGAPHLGHMGQCEDAPECSELTKEDQESQLNIKMTMSRMQLNSKFVNNMFPEWGRFVTAVKLNKGLRDSNYDQLYAYLKQHENSDYYKDKMLLMQAQENEVALDEENLLFLVADDCDAFDSDVDEAPTAQTMFMANLSSADPVYDEASPSYDSDILSEVHDHNHYQDAVCEHHEEHKMHDNEQLNHVVNSHANYMCNAPLRKEDVMS